MSQPNLKSDKNLHSQKSLFFVLIFSIIYASVLFYGSYSSGSLALAADAGHMVAHVSVIIIAFIAATLAQKKAKTNSNSWKIEVLGSLFNSILLLLTAVFIATELSEHLEHQHHLEIDASTMGITALIGLCLHLLNFFILFKVRKQNLNTYAAFLHIAFDMAATFLNIATSIIIYFTGLHILDGVATALIVLGISLSGARLFIKSATLLIDMPLTKINKEDVKKTLLKIDHIQDVHDIRIRPRSQSELEMSAHLVLCEHCYDKNHWIACQAKAERLLREEFGITHSILQIEYDLGHTHSHEPKPSEQ